MMHSPTALPTEPSSIPKIHIRIGMIGLGTVGQGTFKLIERQPHLQLVAVAVRDLSRDRQLPTLDASLMTTDALQVATHPDVDIVIEVAGGIEPAKSYVEAALKAGKHVVTANKALIAQHGPALFQLAQAHGVSLLFEGAVAGGIPILMPLKICLAANQVQEIAGILNGTTNYMLTRMMQDGWTYDAALEKAQALGYAEADPTSDVGGFDAAYKIAILTGLATREWVNVEDMTIEGITTITPPDIDYAKRFGYSIRLVALARLESDRPDVRVHPMLVADNHPLSNVHNEYNAIWVKGHAVGDAMFYGKGAGELPTASSVMGDVLALATGMMAGNTTLMPAMAVHLEKTANVLPIGETRNRYYIRLQTADEPGVLSALGNAFGEQGVSLESFLQLPREKAATDVSLMLVTHEAQEAAVQKALAVIKAQPTTHDVACVLRVL
jgi:homoserine dehydrogenase